MNEEVDMAFCSNCGAQVEGKFCAKCGTMVGAAPPQGASAAPPPPGGTMPPPGAYPATSAGMSDNIASALCYVLGLLSGIFFLVVAPYNQNRLVRFHAFQSILLNLAVVVCWFVFVIAFGILHFVGLFFGLFIYPLLGLGYFILWLYMMFTAYQGRTVVLPVIGPIAQQQA